MEKYETLRPPRLVVTFSRFSSIWGYCYEVKTELSDHWGGVKLLSFKRLHCVFGSQAGLRKGDVNISPKCLHAISGFLGNDGFWGKTIEKGITYDKEWELVKAFKLNFDGVRL